MTTHELIKMAIESKQKKIDVLKKLLETVPNEPALKVCSWCNTKNLHYNPDGNVWVCAHH